MAVNQSHTENRRGVIIPYGESILKRSEDVDLSFPQQPEGSHLFKGTKKGSLFLTSYRMIFVASQAASDPMVSFMMPFNLLSNCSIGQPVFAPNYIQGTIQAAPNGGWEGQATFKLSFRKGGAIEFGQLLMKAASSAASGLPLRSVTLLIVPGNVVCTPETPCVVVWRTPQEFGSPSQGYGPPPPAYGPPPPGYGPAPPGYAPPPPGFVPPSPNYGFPPPGYWPPDSGFSAPPPEGNEAPPTRYEAPPGGQEITPAGSDATPLGEQALPAESRVRPHRSHAAGNEASVPSTSSQVRFQLPKK